MHAIIAQSDQGEVLYYPKLFYTRVEAILFIEEYAKTVPERFFFQIHINWDDHTECLATDKRGQLKDPQKESKKRSKKIVKALKKARKNGTKLGRPKTKGFQFYKAKRLRRQGLSYRAIAQNLGVSRTTVMNKLKEGEK